MKKHELESHYGQYGVLVTHARKLEAAGEHLSSIEACKEAWLYADGMMQYGRRYENEEYRSLEAIEIVLKHAPLIFDSGSLGELRDLLKTFRRIDKNTEEDLTSKLASAEELMRAAHKLWNCIENSPGIRQNSLKKTLGGDQDQWRSIAERWEKMGVLIRDSVAGSYELRFSTRMDSPSNAKCTLCGSTHEVQKSAILEKQNCPQCHAKTNFIYCG
jgi:hypothetical protein